MAPAMLPNVRPVSTSAAPTGIAQTTQSRAPQPSQPKKYNDPLAFDIFSDFKKDEDKTNIKQNQNVEILGLPDEKELNVNTSSVVETSGNSLTSGNSSGVDTLLDFSGELN